MSHTVLELKDISYSYPDSEPALNHISLTINRGDRIAILGNNGAGKSTFFLVCNGILKPQSGKLLYNGSEILHKKQDLIMLRKNVGIVFQDAENQIIASTVESEVSFGPMNLGLPKQEVNNRVNEALLQMNLLTYKKRAPHYLSGGEKKRVSIADILAMQPEVILLDEPTASLDPRNTALLENTLNQLSAAGITLVISTHDVDFAYRFANRAIVFNNGKIIADDTINDVFSNDEIIYQAGLKKPLLYEATALIEKKFGKCGVHTKPKSIEEFYHFLATL